MRKASLPRGKPAWAGRSPFVAPCLAVGHVARARRSFPLAWAVVCRMGLGSGARGGSARQVATGAAPASNGSGTTSSYCEPSEPISKIVNAPPTPLLSFSPCKTRVLLLVRPPSNPPLADFVREELKLAGARLDPNLRAPSKLSSYLAMSLVPLTETLPPQPGKDLPITGIPEDSGINYTSWSPGEPTSSLSLALT